MENDPARWKRSTLHFKLNSKTVYYHVMKLIIEGRLRQERGKLVVGSEWIELARWPVRQRLDG
jgi:hypothetical protein